MREETELLWAEPEALAVVRRVHQTFAIRRRDEQAFRAILDELNDEAVRAISTPSPGAYTEIVEIYETMLLALPETWAKYGQQYVPGIAGEDNPFVFGFSDFVERNLYEQMTLAARGSNRDVAHDALDLPIGVALRALDLRALALTGRMLTLWGAAQRSLMREPKTDERDALLDWARLRLHEYSIRPEHLVTSDDSSDADRNLGKDALLQVFDVMAELAKASIDIDRSDTRTLADLNRYWDEVFSIWNPEHDDPQQWHIDWAVRSHEPEVEIERLRAAFAQNQALVAVKQEVNDWRAMHRLGLLFWVMRNVRDHNDVESWRAAWGAFSGYFSDLRRLAEILDKAIEADHNDRSRWSRWVLDTMQSRTVTGLAIDLELIQTFVILALGHVPPDGPPPEIDPMVWGRGRLDDPAAVVQEVVDNENLQPLLPDDRLDDRVRVLVAALEQMNSTRQRQDEDATIESPLDPSRVLDFEAAFREGWRSHLLVRAVCGAVGALEVVDGEAPTPSGGQVDRALHKGNFVSAGITVSWGGLPGDLGRQLADFEMRHLLERANGSPRHHVDDATSMGDALRAAIEDLRENGFGPSLVVVPSNWEMLNELRIDLSATRGGDVEVPAWVLPDKHRAFLGTVEGVPVIERYGYRTRAIYVLDLLAFGTFRTWRIEAEADGLNVEVTALDEEGAANVVAANPEFEAALSRAERIRRLRQQARLRAVAPFEFDIREPAAGRVIELPTRLRSDLDDDDQLTI